MLTKSHSTVSSIVLKSANTGTSGPQTACDAAPFDLRAERVDTHDLRVRHAGPGRCMTTAGLAEAGHGDPERWAGCLSIGRSKVGLPRVLGRFKRPFSWSQSHVSGALAFSSLRETAAPWAALSDRASTSDELSSTPHPSGARGAIHLLTRGQKRPRGIPSDGADERPISSASALARSPHRTSGCVRRRNGRAVPRRSGLRSRPAPRRAASICRARRQ